MWMSLEDARSDFVLAAAALIFGSLLTAFITSLPIYPGGLPGAVLVPVWIAATMVIPPRFLARYRQQGLAGYGLGTDRSGLTDGALLVLPILAAGYVRSLSPSGVTGAFLGRLNAVGSSTVGTVGLIDLTFNAVVLAVALVGTVLLYGLLVARSRDAFRATDMPLLEALRTYGIGFLGVGTVMGLLLSLIGGPAVLDVALDSGALLATIFIADRMVSSSDRTSRATILAPAIVSVVAFVLAAGGLFGGGLPYGLYRGATAGATAVVFATLLETRRSSWAVIPLAAATLWAPTCGVLPVGFLLTVGAAPYC